MGNKRAFSPVMRGMVEEFQSVAGSRLLFTHREQAAALGMPISTYRKMLTGQHVLDVDEVIRMAAWIGVDEAELVSRARGRVAD